MKASPAIALLGMAFVLSASAENDHFVNAVGACAGALPTHEMALRKRPTGIRNESEQAVFVSCSLPDDISFEAYDVLAVYLRDPRMEDGVLSCTLVNGSILGDTSTYDTRTSETIRDDKHLVVWVAQKVYGDPVFFAPSLNVSCLLPPGSELGMIGAKRE